MDSQEAKVTALTTTEPKDGQQKSSSNFTKEEVEGHIETLDKSVEELIRAKDLLIDQNKKAASALSESNISPQMIHCLCLIEKNHVTQLFGTKEEQALDRGELYLATRDLDLIEKEEIRRLVVKKYFIEHSLNELTSDKKEQ